ncbi:MAG: Stk1 family PASTA domain-containing Ser/Thr kinase [Oscillospiraceae bacterium]|jgi:serine/threonine-protein kinase|nr:Stk1 family PASTA domain-containing Ser/Thr kinase [Oscillospiraceae bacterium]
MDKYIGEELNNRYLVGELVGVGGMSNVYKANDKITCRTVAVKILRDEYLNNPEFLKRFKNESKAIAALSSPNIVNVFDVSFNEISQWIVMEYVDGITLKEYIKKKKVLTWQEAIFFVMQVLRALQHAHDKGIVHRDIKPQNIMLLKSGTVKVMDFGIARFARNDTCTITEQAIGSVHYVSPEQARGGHIDEKTDIYSVGVILFEMVTGSLPFEADSPVSVALKQIQSQPTQPRRLVKTLPIGLEQIIMKALQKDLDYRYQSAAEMLNALILFKQNPAKTFNYSMENTKTDRKRLSNGRNKKQSGGNAEENAREEASWIRLLVTVSVICCFATVAIVAAVLFFSGLFSSSQDIAVPNLLDKEYEIVKNAKEYSKFIIQQETTEYSDKYEVGKICEQRPKAGRLVKNGAIISVRVSRGQKIVKMPNIVGQEYRSAIVELKSWGLEIKEIRVFSGDVEKDFVVQTQPPAASDLLVGSSVTVYVSDGVAEKTVKVPDLNMLTLEGAQKVLQERKLQLGSVSPVNSSEPKDIVLVQNPAKDFEVEIDSAVDVQVSSGVSDAQTRLFNFPVANLSGEVTLAAWVDDEMCQEELLDVTDLSYWKVQLTAKGSHKVKFTVNGANFLVYTVDFDAGTVDVDQDNRNAFGSLVT